MICIPLGLDGDDEVDEKVVVQKAMRFFTKFEFGFEGFGDGEISDAEEAVKEEKT